LVCQELQGQDHCMHKTLQTREAMPYLGVCACAAANTGLH